MSIDKNFAKVTLKLLKGPLYDEDPSWPSLLSQREQIARYLGVIGLELNIHEADGFAYISQNTEMEDEEESLPRIVRRIPLSFEVSLLAVILREELERFDTSNSESMRLFLTMSELREQIRIYFKEKSDETRLSRELDAYIRKAEKLGFLRAVKTGESRIEGDSVYEVMRILKAKITPEFLEEFKGKMESYADTL